MNFLRFLRKLGPLVMAMYDLAVAVAENLPTDWNDEEQIIAWQNAYAEPLARLIALLVPGEAMAARHSARMAVKVALLNKFLGTKPADLDWDQIIDWIAEILCQIFPDQATIIKLVATVLKQLIDLIRQLPQDDEKVRAWLGETG